jgi:nitroreductase
VEFAEVVRRRRMVRAYDPDRPVPPETIAKLLDYAVHAPSAGFAQGWGFLVLTLPEERAKFWDATTDGGPPDRWLSRMQTAPVLIVAHANKQAYLERYAEPDKGWTDRDEARWPVPYWDVDAGFASLMMMLGAVDEGLATCFFGLPAEHVDRYRSTFGVPAAYRPVGVLSIGYRAADVQSPSLRRGRRPVEAVTHWGRWDNTK